MRVVVDHLSGSRRGQRQEFLDRVCVSFGRHPGCDVSFDAHRDLDASSRHAELDVAPDHVTLRDVGSSNGTFVGGQKITEMVIDARNPIVVEFGPGGPQIRLWVGDSAGAAPPTSVSFGRAWRFRWSLVVLPVIAIALVLLAVVLLRGS